MSFSQSTGTAFMPLLSRIVLGSAFLLAGWYHCFSDGSFTADELDQIKSMQTSSSSSAAVAKAVVLQDESDASASSGADDSSAAAESSDDDSNGTRAVYRIALDLKQWGIDGAVPLAWGVAVFEIVAGGLVLIGLFTRLWGFLLAVLIGATFVMTSVQRDGMFDMNPFHWRGDPSTFNEMYFQAAAFVLAVGLMLVGPGVLALDSIVFGRGKGKPEANQSSTPSS